MSKCPYCKKEFPLDRIVAERFQPRGLHADYATLECPECRTILAIRKVG